MSQSLIELRFTLFSCLVVLSSEVPPIPDRPPHGGPIECTQVCTRELEPVCAVDETGREQTFPNKCMIGYLNCKRQTCKYIGLRDTIVTQDFTTS